MRIGINGFGRIGRQVFRMAFEQEGLTVAHINDVAPVESLAPLLRFDTTYGRFGHPVDSAEGALRIDDTVTSVSTEKDPAKIPWGEKGVDVVLEATGVFRSKADAEGHRAAGARKVLISAPGKDALDGDFIIGVNESDYDPEQHHVISIGSCTTNCLAPIAKVMHDELRIQHGLINTVHAYTASQNLLDGPHKVVRRGRAAAENLVPTTTGAASMIGRIIPELQGRLNGLAIRVPVKVGSLLDLTCTVEKETSSEEVNDAFRRWSDGPMRGILVAEDAPIVSSDIIKTEASATVSTMDTQVIGARLVKVLAWYDNEWAFARRCVDMMQRMVTTQTRSLR